VRCTSKYTLKNQYIFNLVFGNEYAQTVEYSRENQILSAVHKKATCTRKSNHADHNGSGKSDSHSQKFDGVETFFQD
jgi:hypothetical protein